MTEEKQEKERAKLQERMKLLRINKSNKEVDQDRESSKMGMRIFRERKVLEERGTLRYEMEDGREDDWYEKILVRSKSTMKDKRAKQNEDKRQDELFV